MSHHHVALYRKYRPQTFSDVVGQESVLQVLTASIATKKISHAYIFCGGRGTGKTTVARIFARDIGCHDEDIIEIDAASNRGIDEIRELREAVRTSPFSSPYKVYIIDEAHMLTKEAANALLKTLEEPPSHVIFILATTDPDKLPETIVSRCQKLVFKVPALHVLSERLMYVAKKEGVPVSDDVSTLIALHGKESYRDALGVLEQVLTLPSHTYTDVALFLGEPDAHIGIALLRAMCEKKVPEIIASITKLKSHSSSLRSYDMLIELIRQALLCRIAGEGNCSRDGALLGKEFPLYINSKLIIELLEKRKLVVASDAHSWTAFEVIMLSLVGE
ncbi:MAG: hypothetical protein RLZZ308_308 [Candidatus Parcubacteria bacterium]|jgi:DNA polymerase III subunit gamma/tau